MADRARSTVVFGTNEKWRMNRNILVLGGAFMLMFTAFHGAANLQSSVHPESGTQTLAAVYGSLILSNILLPALVISKILHKTIVTTHYVPTAGARVSFQSRKGLGLVHHAGQVRVGGPQHKQACAERVVGWLGCKRAICVSFLAYMPFILAQFYPRIYTLVPAGMMVGFGGGPLWCAKCTYLSVVSEPYARLSGVAAEVLVVRFFGLFFMFYQMAQIWGNLISSAILSSNLGEEVSYLNDTLAPSAQALTNLSAVDFGATCGVNFCHGDAGHVNSNLVPPSPLKMQLLAGVYLACIAGAAALVALGVDPLTRYSAGRKCSGDSVSGLRLLAVTLRQLRHKYQLLLLPVIGYIGAEQAFMAADFTQAFVGCAYGISNIGYVMICFGVVNAAAAPVAGALVKLTGRFPVMVAALLLNLCLLSALLSWRPAPAQWLMFYALAAAWGAADAVWLVQVNALSGILFPGNEEAAYSNFRLWEATGSVLSYASAPFLCVRTRLYILLGLLLAGFAGYSTIELMERRERRRRETSAPERETMMK